MKKAIILPFILLLGFLAQAQPCVPGTLTAPKNAYILPDSATNFVAGCQGQYYEQILYIKAAKDTVITITSPITGVLTADIDSFVVEADIPGMPAYLSVVSMPDTLPPAGAASPKSNMTRLVIPGDSLACVKVSGNVPAGAATGTNNLTINLRVYTSNIHSADLLLDALIPTFYPGRKTDTLTDIDYYKIVINPTPCWPASVSDVDRAAFRLQAPVPNPATATTVLRFESDRSAHYTLRVVNALGEEVLRRELDAQSGLNTIPVDASAWANGFYLYSLSDGRSLLSERLQVLH